MKKRVVSILLALCMAAALLPVQGMAASIREDKTIYAHWNEVSSDGNVYQKSGDLNAPKLSKDEIYELLGGNPSGRLSTGDLYDVEPNCAAPYSIGKVKDSVLREAADRLNALRRIAGVPAVTLDAGLCERGQYGAVLLGRLGSISHTPGQPDDMAQSFYSIGAKACEESNISSSWELVYSVDGMMEDSDMNNYRILGHRRWQLNPYMGKVGFGVVNNGKESFYTSSATGTTVSLGKASAMVEMAHDRSGEGCDYDFISWPASGNFPIGEYFHPSGSMWSITLNPAKYAAPNKWLVKIKIVRQSDGAEWYIDKDSNAEDPSYYFNVDVAGYGVPNCIIFHPSNYVNDYSSYEHPLDGDTFTVTVSGLFNKDDTPADDLVYSVNFFDLRTYTPSAAAPVFTDVPAGQWFSDAVAWAADNNITKGTSATTFSPAQDCTQAQILTFLYRAARGGNGEATLEDMSRAVDWAKEKGIIDASFDGGRPCTRATAVSYIWQALGKPAPSGSSSFSDVAAGASCASAVSWAVESGVTSGTTSTTFSPQQVCSRGQIVTFLHRAYVLRTRN